MKSTGALTCLNSGSYVVPEIEPFNRRRSYERTSSFTHKPQGCLSWLWEKISNFCCCFFCCFRCKNIDLLEEPQIKKTQYQDLPIPTSPAISLANSNEYYLNDVVLDKTKLRQELKHIFEVNHCSTSHLDSFLDDFYKLLSLKKMDFPNSYMNFRIANGVVRVSIFDCTKEALRELLPNVELEHVPVHADRETNSFSCMEFEVARGIWRKQLSY